ncbi:MAG TPA: hypothetical protein VJ583_10625 [Nitrososphaeraceae archaeon]|nr:hypothetical protein [Nitrososphaeraceae archaeon]
MTLIDSNYDNYDNDNVRKADNSSTMSVRQQIILECMITQRTTLQTLQILKENGFEITDRTLRRDKNKIRENNLKRLFQIAKTYDFQNQHIEKLQKLEWLERGMFDDIQNCPDAYKRTKIRETIANLQPIMSAYMDSISYVVEKIHPDRIKYYYNNNRK